MKNSDLVVRFAGEAGAGFLTLADMLARSSAQSGYHALTFATFPSQIMGGPTWMQAHISTSPVLSAGDDLDVLVALNEYAYETHYEEIRSGGVLIHDSSFQTPDNDRSLAIPVSDLAKQAGLARAGNMVLIGALAHVLALPLTQFEKYVSDKFHGRDEIITPNIKALNLGFEHAAKNPLKIDKMPAPESPDENQIFIKGNDALCLGALAANVDFYVGYPISPSSSILIFMESKLVGPQKFAYQATSEIESITSVLGASYSGKKAMTATAGPGFSLMSEGLGLAWMAEIPAVIVNVQRGGPATGLPTKTEQSDLYAALTPAHGDIRLPVIAPGTVEECFYAAIHAFNWAERYQGPVVLLSDHNLSERAQNIPIPDFSQLVIEDRKIYKGNNGYQRYEASTVSPMPIPGNPGSYTANGSEHDPFGDTTHLPQRHVQMTRRRFNKLKVLEDGKYEHQNQDAPIAIVPWGGSKGPSLEAFRSLTEQGHDLAWYYTMFLHPLPTKMIEELKRKELVLVPELNYQGQFANVLRTYQINAEPITQYTGLPFKVKTLIDLIVERIENEIAKKVEV